MNFKVTSIEKVVPSCTGSHEAHLTMQETRKRAWNSHVVECAVTICEVARINGIVGWVSCPRGTIVLSERRWRNVTPLRREKALYLCVSQHRCRMQ